MYLTIRAFAWLVVLCVAGRVERWWTGGNVGVLVFSRLNFAYMRLLLESNYLPGADNLVYQKRS